MKKFFIIGVCIIISVVFLFVYYNTRRYIKLIYIEESDYTKVNEGIALHDLPNDCQLTWFGYYPNANINTIKAINETYGTTFDESIFDINSSFSSSYNGDMSKASCFISIGRKLKMLYYGSERYATGSYYDEILPVPVFEKKYDHKIYLYITDKKYHMMAEPELLGEYMEQFNVDGDIPFEEE